MSSPASRMSQSQRRAYNRSTRDQRLADRAKLIADNSMTRSQRQRAACLGKPTRLFYAQTSESTALAICASCPVREACLREELATNAGRGFWDIQGVRGGMTAVDRYVLVTGRPPSDTLMRRFRSMVIDATLP